jgi:FixJ family two-component response regulator
MKMRGLNGRQLQKVLGKKDFQLPIIFSDRPRRYSGERTRHKSRRRRFLVNTRTKKALLEAIERALKHFDDTHERHVQLSALRECVSTLTPRERRAFGLVVRGKLNKHIAFELGISERIFKAHRHSIMEKFKVNSFAKLVSVTDTMGELSGSGGSWFSAAQVIRGQRRQASFILH